MKEKNFEMDKKKRVILIIGIICLCAVCALVVLFLTYDQSTYKKAEKYYNEKQYKEASKRYKKIPDYKDSAEKYKKSNYEYGKQLIDVENYEEAASIFGTLGEYEDSKKYWTQCVYMLSKQLMSEEEYEKAKERLQEIKGYKDSDDLLKEIGHLLEVKEDSTAPIISGLDSETTIKVDYMSSFNVREYFSDKINITDDVSGTIEEYQIMGDDDVYKEDGVIDTSKSGKYSFEIIAIDEAKNEAIVPFFLEIDDVIKITENNRTPTIYDKNQVKISVQDTILDETWGAPYYKVLLLVENSSEKDVYAYAMEVYVDDFKIDQVAGGGTIASGKSGVSESGIRIEDIEAVKGADFKSFEFKIGIAFDFMVETEQKIQVDRSLFEK